MSLEKTIDKNVQLVREIKTVGGTIYPIGTHFRVKEYALNDKEEKIVLTPHNTAIQELTLGVGVANGRETLSDVLSQAETN